MKFIILAAAIITFCGIAVFWDKAKKQAEKDGILDLSGQGRGENNGSNEV